MKLWPTCQCKRALREELAEAYVNLEIVWIWSVQEKNHSKQLKYFEACTELYRDFQEIQATKHKRDCVKDKQNSRFGYKVPNPVRTKKCVCRSKQSLIVSPSQRKKLYEIEKLKIRKELLQLGSDMTRESDAKKKNAIKSKIIALQKRDEDVHRLSVAQVLIDPAVFDAASFYCATASKSEPASVKSVWNMFVFETGYHPPSGY